MQKQICDPDICPIALKCPIGPMPNMPCEIKVTFNHSLNDHLADMFPDISENPEIALRVNYLLRPLFEQLLQLKLFESVAVLKDLAGINDSMRKTVMAIDKVLVNTVKSYNGHFGRKDKIGELTDQSYYDLLLTEGVTSVEQGQDVLNN